MLKLQRASRDIQLWTTIEVIHGYLAGKKENHLEKIYNTLKKEICVYTKGNNPFTVEDFVNYSNKDLEEAGFRRHGTVNEAGEIMYLIPMILYPVMPEELVVFDIDDETYGYPKTMSDVLKQWADDSEEVVAHGIVVKSEEDQSPNHEILAELFERVQPPYDAGDSEHLSVIYKEGVVTIKLITENYGGNRYTNSCEIDARGHKFELGSFIYIMECVSEFLDSIEHVALSYDTYEQWKVNYLIEVQQYLSNK